MAQILLRNITRASNVTLLANTTAPISLAVASNTRCQVHTTPVCCEIRKLARLRVVDNSDLGKRAMAEGRPPRCIHVYNKRGVGLIGDKVLVAIKGQMKKGILVGLKQKQRLKQPQFDSNNLVLIDDNGSPLGTRIHVPIPTVLRTILKEKTLSKGADYTKVLAIASRYV
ncbi:39S ribosomal protein L14, mitochondrial [Drosophila innubila]|uniref:39S ribosomal protein L14, mitochondrial n=1 Tax=Drosophila innubila TaxID=198719 RepID=UPI00148D76A5|nr:39S ribosomal protein L14, mitochondrial [Drosophila innubila]